MNPVAYTASDEDVSGIEIGISGLPVINPSLAKQLPMSGFLKAYMKKKQASAILMTKFQVAPLNVGFQSSEFYSMINYL